MVKVSRIHITSVCEIFKTCIFWKIYFFENVIWKSFENTDYTYFRNFTLVISFENSFSRTHLVENFENVCYECLRKISKVCFLEKLIIENTLGYFLKKFLIYLFEIFSLVCFFENALRYFFENVKYIHFRNVSYLQCFEIYVILYFRNHVFVELLLTLKNMCCNYITRITFDVFVLMCMTHVLYLISWFK